MAEHDPFSLGDSDDEESKKKDVRRGDDSRSKQPTVEVETDDIGMARRQDPGFNEKPSVNLETGHRQGG